jgi:IS1 family transposase
MPAEVKTAAFDEIFLISAIKNRIYLITLVDRATRCFLGWQVAWERSQEIVQAIVDHAPKATWYFSDALDVYASLWYHWGRYAVSEGKTDTYSVEGNNAELRHYLARLARW